PSKSRKTNAVARNWRTEMRVQVTAELIRDGKRRSSDACPVALACQAAGIDVEVGEHFIYFYAKNGRVETVAMPAEVPRLQAFDWAYPSVERVQPFAFELDFSTI